MYLSVKRLSSIHIGSTQASNPVVEIPLLSQMRFSPHHLLHNLFPFLHCIYPFIWCLAPSDFPSASMRYFLLSLLVRFSLTLPWTLNRLTLSRFLRNERRDCSSIIQYPCQTSKIEGKASIPLCYMQQNKSKQAGCGILMQYELWDPI